MLKTHFTDLKGNLDPMSTLFSELLFGVSLKLEAS